jgi:hypothetical protein
VTYQSEHAYVVVTPLGKCIYIGMGPPSISALFVELEYRRQVVHGIFIVIDFGDSRYVKFYHSGYLLPSYVNLAVSITCVLNSSLVFTT